MRLVLEWPLKLSKNGKNIKNNKLNFKNKKINKKYFVYLIFLIIIKGYILGAGSPAHEMGDAATSSEGIVYGHAYSVLSVMDLDGNKLICLRNPHGNASAEWTGDWGDSSYLWVYK